MNKLCSRNTALATAAGRSGCAPVVSQSLAVFSPFDVLVRFTLSFALFSSLFIFFSSLFLFRLASLCYPCSRCLFLAAVDTLAYLIFLPSLFLSGLFLFILNYVTANFRRVSLVLFLLHFSQWSWCISPSHFSCGLYCAHARELRRELQPRRVRARTEFPVRYLALYSVFEPVCRRPYKYQINETAARNLDVLITGV